MNSINLNIRIIDLKKDFELLNKWALAGHGLPFKLDIIPETTYIIEHQNQPIATLCLFLMNCKGGAMVENLLSDLSVDKGIRKEAVNLLFNHVEKVAKEKGYNTLVLFSNVDKLKERYTDLGYKETMSNVSTFAKELV